MLLMSLSKFLTFFFFLILGYLSTLHGPNYLVISAKLRQEFLSAIQVAMNMEFPNPAERRYVTPYMG